MSDFESFYRANLRLVHAVALSRSGSASEAEDLTQEAFLRAWSSFEELASCEPRAQRAWLVAVVRNLATDAWRRRSLDAAATGAPLLPAGEPGEQSELRLDVRQALSVLSEENRELVMMRYLQELNSREIGELLGMPEGTVRRRLGRCRAVLAQHLWQWAPKGAQ